MKKSKLEIFTSLNLLLAVDGFGPRKILSLIKKFNSFENIFNTGYKALIQVSGFNEKSAKKLLNQFDRIEKIKEESIIEIDRLQKLGATIITYFDENYPPLLKEIYSPPLILYILGKADIIQNSAIAIVGTRNPTNYGKIQAEKFSKEICRKGITVVSGLARGIDSAAHTAAINCGGKTIAVTGSGLDVIYPPENSKLYYSILDKGAVVTEFKLGSKPDAKNFPQRNRIISGLSLGTIVIETKKTGGAMQTAAYALDQNREVFAVPGNIGVNQSEGTNILIQRGNAKLVSDADDVLVELNPNIKPKMAKTELKTAIELNMFEEIIFDAIKSEAKHIDEIALHTELSTHECLANLLNLEFKGVVKQLPGKIFCVI